ncbi:uncharacterized protein LOC143186690 [Calliopsis andreniformis]|uniref:uncharacterized protein LOC143186690 n=1 Tax=Calliopsis andreniformis TaxID=337506 RepID=UPI003FCD5E96
MSTTQITKPADIICGLKAAITALECYHHMDMLKQKEPKKIKKVKPPMFMMIPIEEKDTRTSKKKSDTTCKTHTSTKDTRGLKDCIPQDASGKDHCHMLVPDLKFPEMRSGILYTRCYCVHRDGLQDACPLSQCQGQPECLCKPWPICPPARYLRCRHPEVYPPESNSSDKFHQRPLAHAG